jgi:hypothetical protein
MNERIIIKRREKQRKKRKRWWIENKKEIGDEGQQDEGKKMEKYEM